MKKLSSKVFMTLGLLSIVSTANAKSFTIGASSTVYDGDTHTGVAIGWGNRMTTLKKVGLDLSANLSFQGDFNVADLLFMAKYPIIDKLEVGAGVGYTILSLNSNNSNSESSIGGMATSLSLEYLFTKKHSLIIQKTSSKLELVNEKLDCDTTVFNYRYTF